MESRHGREASDRLRERFEHARSVVDDLVERAETAVRERPYLVPAAAGALGVGVGILIGSKLTRFFVFTALGVVLSDTLGGEVRRMSRDFLEELKNRIDTEEHEAPAE